MSYSCNVGWRRALRYAHLILRVNLNNKKINVAKFRLGKVENERRDQNWGERKRVSGVTEAKWGKRRENERKEWKVIPKIIIIYCIAGTIRELGYLYRHPARKMQLYERHVETCFKVNESTTMFITITLWNDRGQVYLDSQRIHLYVRTQEERVSEQQFWSQA